MSETARPLSYGATVRGLQRRLAVLSRPPSPQPLALITATVIAAGDGTATVASGLQVSFPAGLVLGPGSQVVIWLGLAPPVVLCRVIGRVSTGSGYGSGPYGSGPYGG